MKQLLSDKKWRVVLSGAIVTSLPIIGLALFIYLQVDNYIENNVLTENLQSALVCSEHLKEALDNEISLGNLLVSRPLLKGSVRRADRKEIKRHLKDFKDNSVTIDRAYITNSRGIMLADNPTNPSLFNADLSGRPWYKGISRNWRPFVSEFYLRTAKPQRYFFAISLPIRADDNSVIGILVLQPKENYVQNAIAHMPGLQHQIVYVVDKKGNLIYHSKYTVDKVIDFSSFPAAQKVKIGQAGVEIFSSQDGQRMLTAYQPVEGYGWGVVVERPEREVFAPLRKITYGLFAFASVMLLTGVYFAYRRSVLIYSLQKFSDELETRVKERTDELNAANKQLLLEIEERKHKARELNDLYNSAPCGYHSLDKDGVFVRINNTELSWLGYTRDELIGRKTFSDLMTAESSKNFNNNLSLLKERGWLRDIEYELMRKDGTILPVLLNATVVTDDDGNYIMSRDILHDITERKKTEETLLKEKNFSDTVINSLPGMFYLFNEKGRYLKWNRNLEEVTGYSPAEISRMTPVDFFDEEERPMIAEKIREVVINGRADVEAELISKDRNKIPYYFTGTLLDIGGQACVAGTGFDITERVFAEDKIKQAYTELDQIFNSAADGMRLLDMHCNPLKLNKTFLNMANMNEEEAMNRKCYEMFPCPRRNTAKCSIVRVIKGDKLCEEEITIERNDGAKIFCILTVTPFYDSDGSVIGIIEDFKDITERKKLEGQLMQSQKMEAVGTLAGGIAHDFNNLMTAVIGYSDLVLGELPEKHFARDKIRIVRDAGDKAADLVKQLLAFSRKQMLEIKPVNLNDIVWNMNKIFGRTIGEDIELELNINKPVKNVLADAGQVEQILMNLVVNARDAMPGGGRLTIETDSVYLDETYALMHSQLVEPGPYVMLSVADSGIGMSPEIKEKIFEPFFTTKETGRGTGLGLSTTYGIVKQHNGYIWVYSEPGKGTTFRVYLPAIEEEAEEIKKDEPLITVEGTETILVVDDEPLIKQFVIEVLQPRGYNLFEADSAEEALKIAEQVEEKIDLLLTDLIMPGMNGSELRKLFIERWPGIKVCLMSGYGDKEIFGEGMEDIIFIQKPLTPRKLTTKLRELLDSSS